MTSSSSTEPPKLKKLSDMEAGKSYSIVADEVDASLYVVIAGSTPVCIVEGRLGDALDSEDEGIAVLQLIGWAEFSRNMMSQSGFNMFVLDEQPKSSWLLGVWTHRGSAVPFTVAICPNITPKY